MMHMMSHSKRLLSSVKIHGSHGLSSADQLIWLQPIATPQSQGENVQTLTNGKNQVYSAQLALLQDCE